MTQMTSQARWLQWSERAFSFNFIAFSFVMFSCLFPTGFSATFSTLAFVFAVPLFLNRFSLVKLNSFERYGLFLFGWLSLSVIWSSATIVESLRFLSEYRVYFMLPIFILALALNRNTQLWCIFGAMLGALVALIASYGLGLGWWKVEGANLSLSNHIYHGFIMASFMFLCLLIARDETGWVRILAAVVALLVFYNVLIIEKGRTGYLQVGVASVVFIILSFSRFMMLVHLIFVAVLICGAYTIFPKFQDRVNFTVSNVAEVLTNDENHSSAWQRVEYYRGALQIARDHPIAGVGVGDVSSALEAKTLSGEMRISTDNVHSEFFNMLIAGGIPALFLFSGFLVTIGYSGLIARRSSKSIGDALVGISVIILISALFI
mgnify:CR=1 FL=1